MIEVRRPRHTPPRWLPPPHCQVHHHTSNYPTLPLTQLNTDSRRSCTKLSKMGIYSWYECYFNTCTPPLPRILIFQF